MKLTYEERLASAQNDLLKIASRIAALEASRRAKGGPLMNVPRDQNRRVNALLEQLNQ
jgi:hypothetical protein